MGQKFLLFSFLVAQWVLNDDENDGDLSCLLLYVVDGGDACVNERVS